MSLGLNLINVRVKEYLRTSQEKNLNRVLLLDPLYKEEKSLFLLSENDWQESLSAQGFAQTSPLWKSVQDYFSTLSSYRAPVVLAGSLSATSKVSETLQVWQNQSELTYFGHLALVGKTREEIASFSDYMSFCASSSVFLWYWEKEESASFLKNERFGVAVAHNQSRTSKRESAGLLEKSLAEITFFLDKNPNESCLTVLRGATNLESNVFSDSVKLSLQSANVNQYFKSQGYSEFRLGVTTSGESINRIHVIYRWIPQDLALKAKEWWVNTKPRDFDKQTFVSCLSLWLNSYVIAGIFNANHEEIPAYRIVKVEDKREEGKLVWIAQVEFLYNESVFGIEIPLVEVV